MFKVLSDPHTVLKFQNLCGLSKVDPSANEVIESPISNDCSNLTPGDEERTRRRTVLPDLQNEMKSSKVASGGSQELSYNPYLHGLYFFGSSLGDEAFYTSFFPFVFWNVDEYLGRRLIILWVVSMYVGQILKDILRWPRPASPPVIVIERRYESEYGMPSTHATVATIIPFTLVYFTYGRFEYSLWLGAAFVVFWCCLVCLSRIYMGVHSFQDLIGGIALGVLVLLVAVPFLDTRLELLLKNRHFVLPHLFICSLMIYLYPQYTVWTSSRRETARVVGVGCGVLLGFWSVYYLENMAIVDPYEGTPYPFNISTSAVLVGLARCGVGVPVLVLAKLAIKFSMIRVLSGALPHAKLSPKEHAAIDIPTVFVTYTAVGFSAVYVVPKLFGFTGTYM